jgi:hypothetical protein
MVRSIDSLEQRDDLSQMDRSDYRYSWAWVHFMLHGPAAIFHQTWSSTWLAIGSRRLRESCRRSWPKLPNPTDQMINTSSTGIERQKVQFDALASYLA